VHKKAKGPAAVVPPPKPKVPLRSEPDLDVDAGVDTDDEHYDLDYFSGGDSDDDSYATEV
jgi:hypothetical protein